MSTLIKRKRGRPKGTGINDTPLLEQVARLTLDDPQLKKTTAIKRVLAGRDFKTPEALATAVRRLQHKWNAEGPALKEAERKRRASRPNTRVDARFVEEALAARDAASELAKFAKGPADMLREALALSQGAREFLRDYASQRDLIREAAANVALHAETVSSAKQLARMYEENRRLFGNLGSRKLY
ncbi:MAG: hypothetical protein ABJ388_04010 [Alphaproteobacteria bacterium]